MPRPELSAPTLSPEVAATSLGASWSPSVDLHRRLIDYLAHRQLAKPATESFTKQIVQRAEFQSRSPDTLGNPEVGVSPWDRWHP